MTTASRRPVRLVLHPGHPKCGSSSIQDALRRNADELAERGIFYPSRRPNRIFIEACDAQDFDPVEDWLVGLLERAREAACDTLVVSSENLGVRQLVSGGRGLHEVFRRHCQPVDVVYYLRRQDDWMVSMWQQWGHKAGHSLRRFVDDRLGFDEPGYLPAVELFEDVYGGERVVAVPLHGDALVGGNLISDFRERTGVGPLAVEDPDRHRNPSMSGFLCSVLARVPDVYDRSLVERVAEGRTDHSVGRLLERHVSRELLFNRDKRVMPLAERRRVLDHFEDDNRALQARYFPDVAFDAIFGLPEPGGDETLEELRAQVDGLEDVVAMQMQVIVRLLRERESRGLGAGAQRLIERAKGWVRKLKSLASDRT
jgi:hypothetical protein